MLFRWWTLPVRTRNDTKAARRLFFNNAEHPAPDADSCCLEKKMAIV
jgi:hypothetical protein